MCSALLRRVHCLTCAALVLLCSAAVGRAQYAGCANEIPAGYAVVDELRHDNGAGVTHYLTAGVASMQQRTIVHANRYIGGGGLITHICFNARQPDDRGGAPPQQPVRLYISQTDDTRFGDTRPGPAVWNRTVGINGGWQLEEVNPPIAVGAVTWICAEFPTAIPSNGHMGAGTATVQATGQSYVAILNFVGGQDLWVDYEGVQAQGWGYYNGKRPILRGLNLDVSGGSCDPIVVGPAGNQTSESGGFVEFSVALSRVPAQNRNVVVALSVSDPTEADVTPATLIFNSANWGMPQIVRVTGLDDLVADGDVAYSVGGVCYSQDPCFHLRSLPTIGLVNRTIPRCSARRGFRPGSSCSPRRLAGCASPHSRPRHPETSSFSSAGTTNSA